MKRFSSRFRNRRMCVKVWAVCSRRRFESSAAVEIGIGVQNMKRNFFSSIGLRQVVRLSLRISAFSGLLSLFLTPVAPAVSAPESPKSLQIYFIDVEGGQATLFVTPEGQSLLIDTGWPGNNNRDADRIVAAARDAGIKTIDFVLVTHYHDDHVGGAPQLAVKIPIGTFIDHGENRETSDAITQRDWLAYKQLLATGKYKRIIGKPGDILPIQGIRVEVISSDGGLIEKALPRAGQPNPACANSAPPLADK